MTWIVHARRGADRREERVERQGTAYRLARQLHAAGFEVTAAQLSVEDPPRPLGVYRFDGIRFVQLPRL